MNSFYWVFYTLFKSISKAFFSWKVVNREKLIEDGPVLIVSNHQSFLDPPMLGISYEDGIYFFARKTLFQGIFKWALPLCQAIPIDQENPDAASLKHVIRLLKSGKRVLVFPEGSRTPDGEIHDGMGGIGLILSKTKVPVQPLRISGAYEAFPIGARFPRLRPVTVTVGDPIPFTPTELNAKGKDAYQHLTDKIMDAIRSSLRNNPFPGPMISRLKLMDFRCYGSFSWQIPQQGAIILGNNARGKTSLLEAVCFLLRLQSPRTARTGPLVSHGKQSFGIRGELPGQIRRILWAPDAPDLRVNGEPRKDQRSYLADSYPVVWMGNDDLSLVQAGADARRKYMDFLGSQWHPGYRLALFSYRRALKTRNYLLKHRHRDKLQLDAYTRQLALHGTELRNLRANLLALLAPHIALAYRNIGGRQEQVSISYRASEEGDLYERLCASMDRDIRYGQTQNGPHRDDLDITLNGRNAAQFASEGQQRTTAISMKLAQSSLLTEETGHTPIHLIDDVFGELDPTRRIAFLQSLPADAQSLITTTHLDWLHNAPCPLPAFRLEDGALAPL